jgi:hypothetical protein
MFLSHHKALSAFVLMSAVVVCPEMCQAASASINPNCVINADVPNELDCDLLPLNLTGGLSSEVGVAPGTYAVLTNNTGTFVQINQVEAITNEQTYWSEFCVSLNDFRTGQLSAGTGEVGCTTKNPGENYPPLQWDGIHTALSVPPGSKIYLASHTVPSAINHNYIITAYPQSAGINSYRSPEMDKVFDCDGSQQATAWTPWVNNTGAALHLVGATIYAVSGNSGSPNQVSAACIYTLNQSGGIKTANCNGGINQRGEVTFPTLLIEPGEAVVGQAVNFCNSPSNWDWAAYMHVW